MVKSYRVHFENCGLPYTVIETKSKKELCYCEDREVAKLIAKALRALAKKKR